MYDLERLNLIIDDINMYIGKIERMDILSMKKIDDLIFDACSMNCFSLLNKVLDLSEQIVKGRDLGTPFKYRDYFDMLSSVNIINRKLGEKIGDMIILRNKFSHRYDKITEKELLNFVKDVKNIKVFVGKIEEEVRK